MNIIEPIVVGLSQIKQHKLRASLSILGILISVGSVTGIVSMGEGLRATVMGHFDQMGGSSLIWVSPPNRWYRKDGRWVQRNWEDHLTNEDIAHIENAASQIRFVVPRIYMNQDVRYRDASAYARIRASNEYYREIENWEMEKGRFITETDVQNASKVAVIGTELSKDLYGKENPVGKELKVSGMRYLVVGVLAPLKFFDNTNERNMAVPFTTVQKRVYGNDHLGNLQVMADSPDHVEEVASKIRYAIKRSHEHGDEFRVETGQNQIERFNRIVTIMKSVAGGIAGISLLVGGIGIMNIMLVSVTERTREIGIRKAVGAKRWSILWQFLMESVVLCLFGGGLGVLLGIGIGAGISTYVKNLTQMPFESVVTPGLMIFAVTYSACIGLFFGVYPAVRASKLDPVEALRHE